MSIFWVGRLSLSKVLFCDAMVGTGGSPAFGVDDNNDAAIIPFAHHAGHQFVNDPCGKRIPSLVCDMDYGVSFGLT